MFIRKEGHVGKRERDKKKRLVSATEGEKNESNYSFERTALSPRQGRGGT